MKYQHRVIGLLSLLAVITYLDRVCIAVAGPRMQEDLHISTARWGWVTGIFLLSYGAFEIPTGALGDRIGPRKVLTRVVWWWSGWAGRSWALERRPAVATGPAPEQLVATEMHSVAETEPAASQPVALHWAARRGPVRSELAPMSPHELGSELPQPAPGC